MSQPVHPTVQQLYKVLEEAHIREYVVIAERVDPAPVAGEVPVRRTEKQFLIHMVDGDPVRGGNQFKKAMSAIVKHLASSHQDFIGDNEARG